MRFLVGLSLIIAIFATGCARYHSRALAPPPLVNLQEQPVKNGLRVYAKALSPEDCKMLLNRNVVAKGYQPIQLYIENHSDKTYLFSKNAISLPHTNPKDVAMRMHTSTVARATGYGAAAILFTPFFAIPAIIDSVNSSRANDFLDNDYVAKGVRDQTIFPYSNVNMILFVPVELYQRSFAVTLVNEETKAPQKLMASVQ